MAEESTAQATGAQEAAPQTSATPAATGETSASGAKPDVEMIPKARLDDVLSKHKEAQRELEAFRQQQREREEEAAKAAGDIDKFQSENKTLREQVEAYQKRDNDRFAELVEKLPEADQGIIAALGDDASLSAKLAVAEKLAARSRTTESEPGFGSNGGGTKTESTHIPPDVKTPNDYVSWLANLNNSRDGQLILIDREKMKAIREEARERKLR